MLNRRVRSFFVAALFLLTACATRPPQRAFVPPHDPSSFSRPQEVVVRHLDLSLAADFSRHQLEGWAGFRIENLTGASELILDTSRLEIRHVTVDDAETQFRLGDEVKGSGRPLHIPVSAASRYVRIEYATSPESEALQWLDPEQTAGGKLPFLFSQSQPYARSWIPLQDTPGVRFTYSATIRAPRELMAVMSATNPQQKSADGIYRFQMPQPIPSYLMAIAIADLEFRAFDERSGVYAEPSVVDRAAWEFADTPKMMTAAERLYGPYRWDRYDILVLPPSFPFGGMENPRLTFATPTLLAGDRSLVSTIAHELAHSWSGNLVTNAAWNDFWLNEGFTTYIEQRISEEIYGREFAEMNALLGARTLREAVEQLGKTSPATKLARDMNETDEGHYGIGYEKGHFFLRTLEERVGRERFDAFLRNYFDTFAFQPMTSDRFVEYVDRTLAAGDRDLQAHVREWVYQPGIPASMPQPQSDRFDRAEEAAKRFVAGASPTEIDTSKWSTQEWLHFIASLPETPALEQMTALDRAFRFSERGNGEILTAWFERAIRAWYEPAFAPMERYLVSIGRTKLVAPLYAELAKSERGKSWAKAVYAKARPHYHAMTRGVIDRILQ